MSKLRSQKQQRERLVHSLRAEGKSWVDVAEVLRKHFRVNARVALRYAHGWSQRQAADEWNKRWPDELKTVSDLLVDLPDFRHLDPASDPSVPTAAGKILATLPAECRLGSEAGVLAQRLQEVDFAELAQVIGCGYSVSIRARAAVSYCLS